MGYLPLEKESQSHISHLKSQIRSRDIPRYSDLRSNLKPEKRNPRLNIKYHLRLPAAVSSDYLQLVIGDRLDFCFQGVDIRIERLAPC